MKLISEKLILDDTNAKLVRKTFLFKKRFL